MSDIKTRTTDAPVTSVLFAATPNFTRTLVNDADYSVLVSDRTVAFIALTASRVATLPAPIAGEFRYFTIKDESELASIFPISIVVDGGGTIDGVTEVSLRTDDGSVSVYTEGVTYFMDDGRRNDGQVKINDGDGTKPLQTWTGGTVGDFLAYEYDLPLSLSAYPTTRWPRNVDTPADADIYDDTNETFMENTVPGQPNRWRMIFNYSGKATGVVTGVEVRLRNTLSGFVDIHTVAIPSERASGTFSIEMTTISDGASLPAPWGTGHGYVLDVAADDPITIELDSMVRFNGQVD